MSRVAILGANGFFGSRLIEMFHLVGEHEVVPVVHSFSGLARVARFRLDWRLADATDADALATAFAGCDVLVHAIAGALESIVRSPAATLEACRRAGVRRVVYLSTASVHGQDIPPGTDERSPLHARHVVPYNNAKVHAERAFHARHRACGVELVTLRPGIVFGPRDAWISRIARSLTDGTATLVEGGPGWCNTIYVDNLVHAVRCAMAAPVNGEVFLVGDAEAVTWRELYERVALALHVEARVRSVPKPPITAARSGVIDRVKSLPGAQRLADVTPRELKLGLRSVLERGARMRAAAGRAWSERPRDPWLRGPAPVPHVDVETSMLHTCRHHIDNDKARRLLGYEPPVSLDEGITRTVGWLGTLGAG